MGKFKDSKMHGYWEFYRKDGTLMRSGSFDLGKQIGIWTTYDQTGHPYKETEFGS
jgi:antitoxin component YwqK of YwqJK toxin-antitoxin module